MDLNLKEIDSILKKYGYKKNALISILQDIQEKYNWLPQAALRIVSEKLCVPLIDVYSVATFYKAFKLIQPGKHNITVCMGTACHVRGAPTILDKLQERLGIPAGQTTPDYHVTLETVNCLGCCALAPVVVVDGKYSAQTTIQKAEKILSQLKPKEKRTKQKIHSAKHRRKK
ncbi:MAG: NAD(P)H-dependent oxidoreductase subunit E [candidate division WOR-3 bacterium]|nr:NAD(P)H-dependent oxidoreductase subunit E [candidate division WOR-3 bacterium]